jgi:hypothetical protein
VIYLKFNNSNIKADGIAQWFSAGIRAALSGVRVPVGAGNCFSLHSVQTGSVAHAAYPLRTTGLSLGIQRPEREAHQSLESSAQVKNMPSWRGTQLKHRDSFTSPYLTLPYLTFQ